MFQPGTNTRRQNQQRKPEGTKNSSLDYVSDRQTSSGPGCFNSAVNGQNHFINQSLTSGDDLQFPVVVDGSEYMPPGFQNFPLDEISQGKRLWPRQTFEPPYYLSSIEERYPYSARPVMPSPASQNPQYPYTSDSTRHEESPLQRVKLRRSYTDAAVDELFDSQSSNRSSPENSIIDTADVGGIPTVMPNGEDNTSQWGKFCPFREPLENGNPTVSPREAFQPLDNRQGLSTDSLFDQSATLNIQSPSSNFFNSSDDPLTQPMQQYSLVKTPSTGDTAPVDVSGTSPASLDTFSPVSSEKSGSDSDFKPRGASSRPVQAEQNTYACTECLKRFSRPTSLAGHRRTHRGECTAPVTCTTIENVCDKINPLTGTCCNLPFSRPYDLYRHQETIHADQRPVHRCEICNDGKRFSRQDALTRHRRVKHGISSRRGRAKHS